MALRLQIDARAVRRELRALRRRADGMRPLWQAVSQILLRSVRRNFSEGGRPSWKKRKRPAPHPILIKTGRLLASIKALANNQRAEVSTSVIYGPTHHFGRVPIPARPFLVVQPEDEREIASAVERFLIRGSP